jgi:L-alanine-DL-glutamate epimerase-like enolase superfamily enzyme
MKIGTIEPIHLRIPYTGKEFQGASSDMVLVRIETDNGLVGWGQAWSMCLADATRDVLANSVAPICLGQDAASISDLMLKVRKTLGNTRNGPLTFAVSAMDIALWDILGKDAGMPVHRLIGGTARTDLPVYASLITYSDPEVTALKSNEAVEQGFRHLKLHEKTIEPVRAAREAVGGDISIRLDPALAWSTHEAIEMARRLEPFDLVWLEEPVWPPEDYRGLAQVAADTIIPIAAGENCISAMDFRHLWESGAATYLQPSVIKIGGITETLKVMALADLANAPYVPHCFYHGPGFLASLHLAAAWQGDGAVEFPYFELEGLPYGDHVLPEDGIVAVPTGPGLGFDPEPEFLKAYSVR